MGDVTDMSHFMGAVIDGRSFAKLKSAITRAKRNKHLTIIAGGQVDDSVGYFVRAIKTEEVEGERPSYVDVESWRVITETQPGPGEEALSEATVKLRAGGVRYVVAGEGNGPVNALDHALRSAIGQAYPEVARLELVDYKVRILDQGHGTDAITRVLIETADGEGSWVTVGVGHNVVQASWEALLDAVTFGLRRHHR